MPDLAREVVGQWFNLDAALAHTLRDLTRDPGAMTAAYVAGRRARYVHPFKYCLVVTLLYFFCLNLLAIDPTRIGAEMGESMARGSAAEQAPAADAPSTAVPSTDAPSTDAPSTAADAQLEAFLNEISAVYQRHSNNILFLTLPLLALALRVLFRASGRNVAECYAFLLYVTGHARLLTVVLLPLAVWMPGLVAVVGLLFTIGYTAWAARAFFAVGWWRALVRIAVAKIGYTVVTSAVFMLVVVLVLTVRGAGG